MEVLDGVDGLEGGPVLEPHHLFGSVTSSAYGRRGMGRFFLVFLLLFLFLFSRSGNTGTGIQENNTYMSFGHLGAKRLGDVLLNLSTGLVRQVASPAVGDELKLGPDDEVDDARVEAIGPVVVQDLDILGVLKGPPAGPHGRLPAQTLVEDKVGNGAVLLGGRVGELFVAAQLGGDALEALELVAGDDLGDLAPGEDLVGRIGRGDAAEVLGVEAAQELGAFRSALPLGDIDVPEGNDVNGAHAGRRWCSFGLNFGGVFRFYSFCL